LCKTTISAGSIDKKKYQNTKKIGIKFTKKGDYNHSQVIIKKIKQIKRRSIQNQTKKYQNTKQKKGEIKKNNENRDRTQRKEIM